MSAAVPWRFWIDTGGTFTDCLAQAPAGALRRLKVLSTGAVRARIKRVDAAAAARRVALAGLPTVAEDFFAGFTLRRAAGGSGARVVAWSVADETATLDERDDSPALAVGDVVDLSAGEEAPVLAMRLLVGAPPGTALPPAELRLATTRGTNALLERKGANVALFVTQGFGDLLRIGDQRRPDLFALHVVKPPPLHGPVVEVPERLAADGTVVRTLDLQALRAPATMLLRVGVDVAAVALLHSYRNPVHERAVAAFLREMGFAFVSVSSELAPFIKIVPRAETAVADAVLAPVMDRYLSGVAAAINPDRFFVMTSAGGLVRRRAYRPKDSLLSGPAGGVAGAAAVARRAGFEKVITFDMGGTSTDVARFDGDFDYRFQHAVGSARVFAPALRVESVAAGGGSICRFDGAALVVGPESAGADPGPACYGAGGPLTLTDVNLLLGRLDPAKFGVPVFPEAAEAKLGEIAAALKLAGRDVPSRDTLLRGFLEIADERMAEAIRRISVREGYDPAEYALVAFGGAGGLHACAVAERLGIERILAPGDAGLLSAAGLREAVEERFAERQVLRSFPDTRAELPALLAQLEADARALLAADGIATENARVRRAELELRLAGQESGLVVAAHPLDKIEEKFRAEYQARFGYVPTNRAIELVVARIVVSEAPREGRREIFPTASSERAAGLAGPTLVQDRFSTLFVATGWAGRNGSERTILLERGERGGAGREEIMPEVAALELFTNRFRGLVEEMGVLLQRCALSVNVKERLDFSCALLDADGELVANAPHIPVHLGALGVCVRRVRETLALGRGDVAVTNHPGWGGSHLPDVTLIAPVHAAGGELIGYVANRAHHAEIGGTRPGSMPPQARCLAEEGAVIAPMYLARGGAVDWDSMRRVLASGPHPSRAIEENIADLHAQLASVRRGAGALEHLAATHGAARLRDFMQLLKTRAAAALAEALVNIPDGQRLAAADALDDGSRIVLTIERRGARLVVDFSGTSDVHPGNLNATPAIVRSAVIYVLRLLAGRDLPLNEGLMRDVDLVVPRGMLAPDFPEDARACPAVVGGNVETSQRVVDVLLQAFGLAACSQGTMNNVIFGNARFSYYETVCGGTGAGPGFDGTDAVHSHMTNTAITDVEIFESRLPVRLERFAIRRASGGAGAWRGGDGCERAFRFLEGVSLSLLAQRRRAGPPGAAGGDAGSPGVQWIERHDGIREALTGESAAEIAAGDGLVLLTPGGGAWGKCPKGSG